MQSAYFTLFIQIPLKSERNDLIWPSRVGLFCNKIKNLCLAKCICTTSHFQEDWKSRDKTVRNGPKFPLTAHTQDESLKAGHCKPTCRNPSTNTFLTDGASVCPLPPATLEGSSKFRRANPRFPLADCSELWRFFLANNCNQAIAYCTSLAFLANSNNGEKKRYISTHFFKSPLSINS